MKLTIAILAVLLALKASAAIVPLAWTQTDTNGVTGFDFVNAKTGALLGHVDGCGATNCQVICAYGTVIAAQACYDDGPNSVNSNLVTNTIKTAPLIWRFLKP
jgi:hypothetical protein